MGFSLEMQGLHGRAEIKFMRNLSFNAEASVGIFDNFDELKLASDSVLPHVRSDIVKYMKATRDSSINRLQLNYFLNPQNDFYAKISMEVSWKICLAESVGKFFIVPCTKTLLLAQSFGLLNNETMIWTLVFRLYN